MNRGFPFNFSKKIDLEFTNFDLILMRFHTGGRCSNPSGPKNLLHFFSSFEVILYPQVGLWGSKWFTYN